MSEMNTKINQKNNTQLLKVEILKKLKENHKAKLRLCYEFNISMNTLNRMIERNDIKLTVPMSISAIAEELQIKKSQILTSN